MRVVSYLLKWCAAMFCTSFLLMMAFDALGWKSPVMGAFIIIASFAVAELVVEKPKL